MARNRRRAKERRRSQPVAARPGDGLLAAADPRPGGAPDPIAHASPDAELAAAQLAIGAPEESAELDPAADEELEELGGDDAVDELDGDGVVAGSGGAGRSGGSGGSGRRSAGGGELAVPGAGGIAGRVSVASRLLTFLRGSWAELQRVQWPDRRQVVQATGVVIGFVIVAGVFLGLSDLASSHLIDWILK